MSVLCQSYYVKCKKNVMSQEVVNNLSRIRCQPPFNVLYATYLHRLLPSPAIANLRLDSYREDFISATNRSTHDSKDTIDPFSPVTVNVANAKPDGVMGLKSHRDSMASL